jgi:hypothetical protein
MTPNGHQEILRQCPPAPEPECKDPWEEPYPVMKGIRCHVGKEIHPQSSKGKSFKPGKWLGWRL